jgi:hypothetical protein
MVHHAHNEELDQTNLLFEQNLTKSPLVMIVRVLWCFHFLGQVTAHPSSQHAFFYSLINRIPVMAVILRPLFGVLFLRGHISLKKRTYCPVMRESANPFKSTCLHIELKEAKIALYGLHLQR